MTARDAWAQVAHDLRALAASIDAAIEQPVREPAAVPGRASAPLAPAPAHSPAVDTSVCPKHGKAFVPSKNPDWPSYCPSSSDDPAWSNAKGYCRINSKNAGEWLAVNGRAA